MAASGSGVERNALNQAGNAASTASTAVNTLNPIYSKLSTGTVGYSPQERADLITAGEQSTGGSQAGAVGAGNLYAARTNNFGGAAAAIADSARNGMAQNSDDALKVATDSDALATQNQRFGLSGLNSIYDDANKTGGDYLNTAQQANAVNQAWKGQLIGAAGNALGTWAGTGFKTGGCWIAEAVYGTDDPRTHIVRAYLNGDFRKAYIGNFLMWAYLAIGQQVAWCVRRSRTLRTFFRPLFDLALARAVVPMLTANSIPAWHPQLAGPDYRPVGPALEAMYGSASGRRREAA